MFFLRSLVFILISSLVFSPSINYAQQVSVLGLPQPGSMVSLSSSYVPVIIKGLHIHPDNPILFDFILDTGDSGLDTASPRLRFESEKLIKYFLASLTIPDNDLWVNLSPYEKNRIIPEQLGQTVMGRDMLAQDYILKQLTASLIYPERNLGKEFWSKVYTRSQQLFGSREIPINTFNKVWIVADKAKVYVHNNTAFVVASHMKVMLEEDYLAMYKHGQSGVVKPANSIGSQVVREVVLPELEKEVNKGKNFANLRQIFNSMILAAWYKKNLKEALLNQVYSNKAKINGIDVQDKTIKERIYQEYLKAYKKGVFNYIKEDVQADGQTIPRKYFSGGEIFRGVFHDLAQTSDAADHDVVLFASRGATGTFVNELVTMPSQNNPASHDFAMNSELKDTRRIKEIGNVKIESVFKIPVQLNPGVSDRIFLQTMPDGVQSWDDASRLEKEASEGSQDAAKILTGLINLSNVNPWLNGLANSLKPAKIRFMEQFRTPKTDEDALESLRNGEFFVEALAGGAAERARASLINLGLNLPESYYRIWNIKFWDIIRAAKEGILKPTTEESRLLLESIKDLPIPDFEKEYTIGQRLLYALSAGIDDIPDTTDQDKIKIRKNLKIVIHVNDDILDDVTRDFKKFNFFGFTPSNILIVNGGYGPAYRITKNGLEEEKDTKVTWNHLFAFMENKWKKKEVYTFNDVTKERYDSGKTVNSFLNSRGAKYGLIRRVNDAILLQPQGAMDWQFLSAFLGARQKLNANVLFQGMPNTTKNKGGLVLKKAGSETFSVPFETLDSLDFDIQRKLNEMDETPYNRLYMVYDLKSVDEATDTHTIPLSLKIKATPIKGKNVFLVSPESPIGNLLLVPGIDGLMVERENDLLFDNKILTPQASEGQYTPGFKGHLPGERIHDIKTADDFVRNLGPIYTAMDREINLEEFASRFKDRPQKPNGKTTPNVKKDMAQTANGGIDLNAGNLQMEINGEKIDLKFDPAMVEQFQRGDFSGVAPVIIQITAIQNPMSLLGVDLGKEEEAVLH